MSKSQPSSVTIEEAVARMVNMDYIPEGFTLLEMTDAFKEEGEIEYENAVIDNLPKDELTRLKLLMRSCIARNALAKRLMKCLQYEVKHPKNSEIIIADDGSSQIRLTLESVSRWSALNYGIGIPEWNPDDASIPDADWEDVTIKIYKDHKIGFFVKGKHIEMTSFIAVGLKGKRKNSPNQQGLILIGLSEGGVYPPGNSLEPRESKALSLLSTNLKTWIKVKGNPFAPYNKTDGWKPRFRLIDDRRNADERAKEKAIYVKTDVENISKDDNGYCFENEPEGEAENYHMEDDSAQSFLDEN